MMAVVLIASGAAFGQCALNPTSPSVTICSPANGSTVSSPVNVVAGTTDNAHPVTTMRLYVDNNAVSTVNSNQLNTTVSLANGSHNITVNAWDSSGAVFKATSLITVGPGGGTAPVSVAIQPTSASLNPGQTQQFTATVLNTSNTAVTWLVDGVVGGNSTTGMITTNGLYTAPSVAGNHSVVARSVADSTKSDTATVAVNSTSGNTGGGSCLPTGTNNTVNVCSPQPNSTVTSPVHMQAAANSATAVQKFLIYVDNNLMYQVNNVNTVDTFLSLAQGPHTVVFQYYNNAWVLATENITVGTGAPSVSVAISPTSASLATGATKQFTATVSNASDTSVTWLVDGVVGGNANTGTISNTGLYQAPSTAGNHTVTATSNQDNTKSANATVTVTSGGGGGGSCTATSALTICSPSDGSTVTSPVHVQAAANVSSTQKFLVYDNNNLVYQAPAGVNSIDTMISMAVGAHKVVVQYYATSWVVGTVNITVGTGGGGGSVGVSISPTTATIATGATQQFSASVSNASNTSVTWSVDGVAGGSSTVGTVSSTGLYTAPGTAGSHTVTATSVQDTTKSASATVTVTSGGGGGGACAGSGVNNTITICSPSNGASLTSPVEVSATANSTNAVQSFLVYDNNVLVYQAPAGAKTIDTQLMLAAGAHKIVAQYYNGTWILGTVNITVTSGGGGGGGTPGTVPVWTYHNDEARTGQNLQETKLTHSNVNPSTFGKKASYAVDGQIYAQPLYVPNVSINGANHNVVYVATENDSVYAFDADGLQSTPLWARSILVSGSSPVPTNDVEGISPKVGITGTPVIDLGTNTMFVVSMQHESVGNTYRLHALDLATGAEKAGGPARITPQVSGTGADNVNGVITIAGGCYQRPGLALANGRIYVAWGHCSHGWIAAYSESTLGQVGVFNPSASGKGAAIWSSGGAPVIDGSGNVYVMTGADADSTISGYSDSFLRLSSTLGLLDFFMPANNATLISNDADLGSGSPMLLPGNVLIGAGKDGRIFLLNPGNLGGFHNPDQVLQVVQSGARQFDNFFDTPAYWNGNVYYHAEGDVLRQFSYSGGKISTSPVHTATVAFGVHGATPSISANGTSDAIVWEVDSGGQPNGAPAVLYAYDATNVGVQLWNSNMSGSRDVAGPAVKFVVPTIADGKVFLGTANQLNIYGLLQ